ncbi:MAG: hypothetical protein JJ909_02690 [Roseivirga sp.]|uniref:DUF6088 family protein n=1 Tax=Roseivirga sp. TaxID=1964215 RepID=UPI001AFD6254|nr:DUF6088 family protein [Roseivirga sp.]MBO6659574.1 hypothetical protein [Roseivirga sp.]MBO6759867.1 hypothetical protein [Roseivirga sp.]MBO6907689.1 hypothetical protein [Roseivirga sp.]
MKITQYIKNKIERLPKGYVFTYDDFIGEVDSVEAIVKALNRMVDAGTIAKLSKGKYYKPEETVFGTLGPDRREVVKDLLEKNGKLIGYLTGYSIYNELGFTTQVSNTIQIGRAKPRPATKRGRYKIKFIVQKNTITKENVPLLQLLDVIRYIKEIPDASIDNSCQRMIALLREREPDFNSLVRLVKNYPPATRALLGAILEYVSDDFINNPFNITSLKNTLNPITKYQLKISESALPTKDHWNII